MKSPRITATLDLSVDSERTVCETLLRAHSGKRPTWKMLHIRREGSELVELACWNRSRTPSFTILRWSLEAVRVCWQDYDTRADAEREFFSN